MPPRRTPSGAEVLRLLTGDLVPAPVRGPDGRYRPPIPVGRRVELPGRGTTFVREVPGPLGAPTVLLLHGWMASGGLNWFRTFETLGQEFRVVAPDLRGHGRGLRSRRHVRLSDSADDLAALLDELGTGPVVAAGYSMGGPIAQLLWHRHPKQVSGLVLCATAADFQRGTVAGRSFDAWLAGLAGAARLTEPLAALPATGARLLRRARAHRPAGFLEWAAEELRRHDVRMLVESARMITRYDATGWIREVDVPTSVVITTRDRVVMPATQGELAAAIPRTRVVEHVGGHLACSRSTFAAPMLEACRDVAWHAA
ncbi:MAG: alpha/beta hydrolase [Actinobacteria bacterium]|nr:alpha/beta hydrolase [Actinomycetota bacterium]